MIDTAIVFAAGLGLRMRSDVSGIPKAIYRVNCRCLLDMVINQIVSAGIRRIIINAYFKAEEIIAHLKSQVNNVSITVVMEPRLLETGGSLVNILRLIGHDGTVLTCNADTIWSEKSASGSQILNLINTWHGLPNDKKLLMLVTDSMYGAPKNFDFELCGDRLRMFNTNGSARHYYMGSQIIDPSVLSGSKKEVFSLGEVYADLCDESGILRNTYALSFNGRDVFHVGDGETLALARQYCSSNMELNW